MSCSSATATRLGVGHAVHFAGSARTFPAAVLRARARVSERATRRRRSGAGCGTAEVKSGTTHLKARRRTLELFRMEMWRCGDH